MVDDLQQPPHYPVKWVFVLFSFVITTALLAVLVWLFTTESPFRYPMIVALLCFALSTVGSLVFAAHAKLEATLPIASITMAGPAVIWIAVFVLWSYVVPFPVQSQQSFVDVLRMQTLRAGWMVYPDWVKHLGQLSEEVLRDEGSQVRQILDSSFNTGLGRQKVSSPLLDTMFLYLNDKTSVKLQRIRGSKGDIAEIYFRPSTTQAGTASGIFLAKSNEAIVVNELGGQRDWREVRTDTLDCFVIAIYNEGMLSLGDFIYTSTNKYRKDGNAVLSMGILTDHPIQEPKSWLFRGFPFPLSDEVPVVFKRRFAAWSSNVDSVVSQMGDWFKLLDQNPLDSRLSQDSVKFIERVRSMLPNRTFAEFYKSTDFKSAYSVRFDNLQDAIVVTFER